MIDEGALSLDRTDLVRAASLTALSWAADGSGAVAVYALGSDLAVSTLPATGTTVGGGTLMGPASTPLPKSTAVAGDEAGDYAIAYAAGSGCSRIVLGTWSGSGTSLTMPDGHQNTGLPKAERRHVHRRQHQPGGLPALASAVDRQVLLAYLADDGDRSCGGDAVDVGLVVAQRMTTSGSFGETGPVASGVVGQSVDGAPALVAIDSTFGYLLAFARSDGTIGVHRVQVDGTTLAATVTSDVYVETCSSGSCGDVALTAAQVDSGYQVALTYRDGDCSQASAALRVLSLDTTAGTLTAAGDVQHSASASTLRYPVAARRTSPDEWLLTWSYNAGMQRAVAMQRFDANVAPVGEARDVLTTSGVFSQPIAATGGTGSDGYHVFAYDTSSPATLTRAGAQCP